MEIKEIKSQLARTAELTVITSTEKKALPADDLGARRAVSRCFLRRIDLWK